MRPAPKCRLAACGAPAGVGCAVTGGRSVSGLGHFSGLSLGPLSFRGVRLPVSGIVLAGAQLGDRGISPPLRYTFRATASSLVSAIPLLPASIHPPIIPFPEISNGHRTPPGHANAQNFLRACDTGTVDMGDPG